MELLWTRYWTIESSAAMVETPGVLETTRAVVEVGELAWINHDRLAAVADQLREFKRQEERQSGRRGIAPAFTWYTQYHFFDGTERTVNWLLLLDALNFCFWADKGQARWQIEYHGARLDGYWAEAASLTRAVEEGYPLWDARYLSEMSSADLAHILRGVAAEDGQAQRDDNRREGRHYMTHAPADRNVVAPLAGAIAPVVIPLFEQRLGNAREVGRVLLERYDGQFANALEEAGGSAVRLALLLAEHFASFHDIATYRNHEVRFLKRAQLCAADVHGAFGGKQWGAFHDLDRLTVFADYKLPQILRHFGALEYHPALAARIDALQELEAGSAEEIEIRAATIWACELLRQAMAEREAITAAEIDARLWLLSQHLAGMRPYHRVRTIYY
jgi:Queuosine salvage protein